MGDLAGLIRAVDHVGFPSHHDDWIEIQAFWESLEMTCSIKEIEDEDYDHAGKGPRLQVFSGAQLLVSYFITNLPAGSIRRSMRSQHLGLTMCPPALDAVRTHPNFDRETPWGMSNTSIFLRGPYGLHVELVTTDPGYHADA
ncbi:hypothetical protein HQ487_04360 [Candidatus Uhrbacteria bacterium]|nr:hypothetical protein [Candidatus Uhrbacteria bacterium]